MGEHSVNQFMHARCLSKDGQGTAEVWAAVGLIYEGGVLLSLSL